RYEQDRQVRSTGYLASVHADGGVVPARDRPRGGELPRRHRWKPLPRWRLLAVVQRAWSRTPTARCGAARAARQARPLDVPRPDPRGRRPARGGARRHRAAGTDPRLLFGLRIDRGRDRTQAVVSVLAAPRSTCE